MGRSVRPGDRRRRRRHRRRTGRRRTTWRPPSPWRWRRSSCSASSARGGVAAGLAGRGRCRADRRPPRHRSRPGHAALPSPARRRRPVDARRRGDRVAARRASRPRRSDAARGPAAAFRSPPRCRATRSCVPGDRVDGRGPIRPRPDSPYGDYLAPDRRGRDADIADAPDRAAADGPGRRLEELRRRRRARRSRGSCPEPEAGLAAGILIGLRDRVDRDLAAAFTTAGVSHVVAISGWNIAIVAAAVAAVRRPARAPPAVGGDDRSRSSPTSRSPAPRRRSCAPRAMAGVVLLARESRAARAGRPRRSAGRRSLLLLADPALIGDAGFQLSSLATAGLIAWATPLTAWIETTGARTAAALAGREPRASRSRPRPRRCRSCSSRSAGWRSSRRSSTSPSCRSSRRRWRSASSRSPAGCAVAGRAPGGRRRGARRRPAGCVLRILGRDRRGRGEPAVRERDARAAVRRRRRRPVERGPGWPRPGGDAAAATPDATAGASRSSSAAIGASGAAEPRRRGRRPDGRAARASRDDGAGRRRRGRRRRRRGAAERRSPGSRSSMSARATPSWSRGRAAAACSSTAARTPTGCWSRSTSGSRRGTAGSTSSS